MKLSKCPRCDLNYITEAEKYCKVCLREMKGDAPKEEIELCSICNEEPALPGKDVCLMCYKEMNQQQGLRDDSGDDSDTTPDVSIDMEDVSEMQEIELETLPEDMPAEAAEAASAETAGALLL